MAIEPAASATMDAFSQLRWHDAELGAWTVSSDEPTVTLRVVFPDAARTEVRFHDVRGFYADVDLLAKKLCGDQIASGRCEDAETSGEPFVQRLDARFDLYPGEPIHGLFLFTVRLIHPGGEIRVLARSFSLSPTP
jgi:hypothetical protein